MLHIDPWTLAVSAEHETPPPPVTVKPRYPENTPKPPAPVPVGIPHVLRRVNAVCGSGDATLSIASFGGTIHIKKI